MRNTEKAFLWITSILEQNKISYKISGGFAARAYGVQRELADIDIDIPERDIPTIAHEASSYIKRGPERFKDQQWDLELLTLLYEGQEIDISGVEARIFNQQTKQWENCSGSLDNITLLDVYGKKVPIENINSLIVYKSKLSRDVDREDVRQLTELLSNRV